LEWLTARKMLTDVYEKYSSGYIRQVRVYGHYTDLSIIDTGKPGCD
jgi:hypothetical protein